MSHTSLVFQKKTAEKHLLDSGKHLKALNFNKALWPEIQAELQEIDWSKMDEVAKFCPKDALNIFMDEIVSVLERHVPRKAGKFRCMIDRKRKLLWRRLGKIKRKKD